MNSRDLKKLQLEFKEKIEEFAKSDLNISGVDGVVSQDDFKGDLSKLVSCSKNYYEDIVKVFCDVSKVLEVSSDLKLDVLGSGILYIVVKKNCSLNLNFISSKYSFPYIKIFVKNRVSLNLIEFINSKNLYKNVEVILEKNSSLKSAQFNMASSMSINEVSLNESSNYDLKSAYFCSFLKNRIINISKHIGRNSNSNMNVKGVVISNGEVTNDGLVLIGAEAFKSEGYQKMENIILDDKSKVFSEPVLEINNNDVKCSHGSSISQLSDDLLFYMNSRGIPKSDAINLFAKGFFEEAAKNILDKKLRDEILEKVKFE